MRRRMGGDGSTRQDQAGMICVTAGTRAAHIRGVSGVVSASYPAAYDGPSDLGGRPGM